MDEARNRLITAALRVAAAERGGLDSQDSQTELENALSVFDEAVAEYVAWTPPQDDEEM